MRRFVGIELGEDRVPDESTILRFRQLLERNRLTEAVFEERLLLKAGTIVDATIVHAPSSTKNQAKARDPEMRQTKKGNMWHFGMKVHVGTDVQGLVHHLTVTDAAESETSCRSCCMDRSVRRSETVHTGVRETARTLRP